MSTLFSIPPANDDVDVKTSTQTSPVSLVARKHYSFDERERIKKRRKQLNPVRLSLEYVRSTEDSITDRDDTSDTDSTADKHITYSYPAAVVEPSKTFKSDVNPSDTIPAPLNLTKNSRIDEFTPSDVFTNTAIRNADDAKLNLYPRKDDELKYSPVKNQLPDQDYDHFMANAFATTDEKLKDQSPPFSPRTPPVSVMRSLFTNAVTRTSCRIFNPEAFCNICNKEFCNKYFLKTHKANKHGIYCETKDNAVDTESIHTNAVPLMFTWNVKNNNVKLPSNPYLLSANAVKDSSAFCNICEKEFCNKYFLRRHKEKMHGIVSLSDPKKTDSTSCDSEKYNETEDQVAIADTRMPAQTDDKYSNFFPQDVTRKNELNQADVLGKTVKDGKLKYPKYSANATDAVSDFIKICLTNSVAKNSSTPKAPNTDPVKEENNKNIFSESIREPEKLASFKKEENFTPEYNCHQTNISVENARITPKPISTGEFGVQAKEEDFHEINDKNLPKGNYQRIKNETRDDEKSHLCEICKKSLSAYSIMKLHQKYVHNLTVEDDDPEYKRMENIYFMILKFSWLNTVVTYCEICKTEFDKNDILEMHLMNKHGNLVDEISRIIEDAGPNGMLVPATNSPDGTLLCQMCNKTFNSNVSFQQHVYEKCGVPDFKDYSDYFPSLSTDDATNESSKTRNFCEICKKELCNKYFMKTHMRRMHGISIQNGVRIGGVTCEICNKELCSKYFLRVHKKNCHGIMENMQFARLMVSQNEDKEESQKHVSQICAICGRIFKSMKWLKTHLFNDHGKLGATVWQDILASFNDHDSSTTSVEETEYSNQVSSPYAIDVDENKSQIYQCSKCQFQAASMDVLTTHQRLHSKSTGEFQYRCMYCFVITKDKVSLEEHIAYHHFGNLTDFQDSSNNDFGARFATKGMMELDTSPYDLNLTNGNCARVIDYDRNN